MTLLAVPAAPAVPVVPVAPAAIPTARLALLVLKAIPVRVVQAALRAETAIWRPVRVCRAIQLMGIRIIRVQVIPALRASQVVQECRRPIPRICNSARAAAEELPR